VRWMNALCQIGAVCARLNGLPGQHAPGLLLFFLGMQSPVLPLKEIGKEQ